MAQECRVSDAIWIQILTDERQTNNASQAHGGDGFPLTGDWGVYPRRRLYGTRVTSLYERLLQLYNCTACFLHRDSEAATTFLAVCSLHLCLHLLHASVVAQIRSAFYA